MRLSLFFLTTLSLAFGGETELPNSLIIPDTANLTIASPSFSERRSVKVRLGNELEAYIVSDPQLKECALALTVEAGNWDDTAPGMAHFVEHMLFMGSKNYPTIDEFAKFVSDNGGKYNAFTASMQTTYMFSVRPHAFHEATRRLVDFFVHPLFKAEGIADERKAVDQEFSRCIDQDHYRLYYIEKELASKDHPFSHFGCGNLKTLGKVTRDEVVNFHENKYSSNLMHLVLYSPQPLDQLKALVEQEFSQIKNSHLTKTQHPGPILTHERKQHIVYLPARQETKHLEITWELPSYLVNNTSHHTSTLISRILANEAPGSLITELKAKGYGNKVQTSFSRMSQSNALFSLEVELTNSGVENHKEVISLIYSHLAALRNAGLPSYLYEDMQTSDRLSYTYQTPQDGFRQAWRDGSTILYESLSTFPQEASIAPAFDETIAEQLLEQLTPRGAAIACIASTGLTGAVPSQTEQWTGAEYALEKIAPEQIRSWEMLPPAKSFALPKKNPYLPKSLPTVTKAAEAKPQSMEDSPSGRFYHCPDSYFAVPKTSLSFAIKTPKTEISSARADAYMRLLLEMLRDQSQQTSYLAKQAGMQAGFYFSRGALHLIVSGWSPSVEPLALQELACLKNLRTDKDHFIRAKERALTSLRYQQKSSPIALASQVSAKIFTSDYMPSEIERALIPLQQGDFARFYETLMQKAYVESVTCGAHTLSEASGLKDKAVAALNAKPYPTHDQKTRKSLLLPTTAPLAIKQSFAHASNAAQLHIQAPEQTLQSEVLMQLLAKGVRPLFFEELRTNQQTGYANYVSFSKNENVPVLTFTIQSATHSPEELIARYELFLEDYLRKIDTNLSAERFETLRSALVDTYNEPPHNLDEMNGEIRVQAFDYCERFDLRNEKIELAKNLTHAETVAFAKKLFGRKNPRRLAILVEGSSNTPDMRYQVMKSPRHIQRSGELTSFKDALIFTPQ